MPSRVTRRKPCLQKPLSSKQRAKGRCNSAGRCRDKHAITELKTDYSISVELSDVFARTETDSPIEATADR